MPSRFSIAKLRPAVGAGQCAGLYLSDCAEKAPIPAALDRDLAKQWWELSEKAVGTT
jgi:hypothetical protein